MAVSAIMLGIFSAVALFLISILGLFFKTVNPYQEGWLRKLTAWGKAFIALSTISFCSLLWTSISSLSNSAIRSEAAVEEIRFACDEFLEMYFRIYIHATAMYEGAGLQAQKYDGELASELSTLTDRYYKDLHALMLFDGSQKVENLESLLADGCPPDVLTIDLQWCPRGSLPTQEFIEMKAKQFEQRLDQIMNRYQGSLSPAEISSLLALRYHMLLRNLDYEAVGLAKSKKRTFQDYYITIGDLNDLLRRTINGARGRF